LTAASETWQAQASQAIVLQSVPIRASFALRPFAVAVRRRRLALGLIEALPLRNCIANHPV
jgi:hypothetical protein